MNRIKTVWVQPVCLSGVPVGAELETSQEQTEESPLREVHLFFYVSNKNIRCFLFFMFPVCFSRKCSGREPLQVQTPVSRLNSHRTLHRFLFGWMIIVKSHVLFLCVKATCQTKPRACWPRRGGRSLSQRGRSLTHHGQVVSLILFWNRSQCLMC